MAHLTHLTTRRLVFGINQNMGSYRTLVAWQRAMDLCDAVYHVVRDFPRHELFGLSQQLRSAAVSVPSLLAEGRGRYTIADQQHFYREARGSTHEVQTQIEIAARQKFITTDQSKALMEIADEVGRLINGLLASLKRPKAQGPKALRPKA